MRKLITNREEALQAVNIDGFNLRFCSDELKDDSLLVLDAVEKMPIVILLASQELRDCHPLALFAVELDGEAIDCVSDRLKNDPEIVLTALKQNPNSIVYAGEKILSEIGKNDPIKYLERKILSTQLANKT